MGRLMSCHKGEFLLLFVAFLFATKNSLFRLQTYACPQVFFINDSRFLCQCVMNDWPLLFYSMCVWIKESRTRRELKDDFLLSFEPFCDLLYKALQAMSNSAKFYKIVQ